VQTLEEKTTSYERLKQYSKDEFRKLKEQHAAALAASEQKLRDYATQLKRELGESRTRESTLNSEMEVCVYIFSHLNFNLCTV
jgi:hypothetical protein